jgi:hypothetical protein
MGVCPCFPHKTNSKLITKNLVQKETSHQFEYVLNKTEENHLCKAHSNPVNKIK